MNKNITIYSMPTCSKCMLAKLFLKDNNIDYDEIDVSNADALEKLTVKYPDLLTLPVIELNGEVLFGFDEDALMKRIYHNG